jgi:hypothetical protein
VDDGGEGAADLRPPHQRARPDLSLNLARHDVRSSGFQGARTGAGRARAQFTPD